MTADAVRPMQADSGMVDPPARSLLAEWIAALRSEAPLIVSAWGFIGLLLVLNAVVDSHRAVIGFRSEWPGVMLLFVTVAAPVAMLRLLQQGHSMRQRETWVRFAHLLTPRTLLRWIVGCSLFWPFLDAFGWVKSRIPLINPYPWDPDFARIDAFLHFGRQPWEWTALVFHGERAVRFLDWAYGPGFAAVMLACLFWAALAERNPARRMQALLTYVGIWIVLGSVLAIVFASVGPCYYGEWVAGPDPFAPLLADLHAYHARKPLIAVASQGFLWAGFQRQTVPLGVSAMPSVHVAIGAWVALWLWRTRLAPLGIAFAALVLMGSVRLAWHYAIDGYVSIALVLLMWHLAGRYARAREMRSAG